MSAWLLRLYPPSFRSRYGAELAALVEDLGGKQSWDLLRGAARAWLRPSFTGADAVRRRRQATAATVWAAWCAGFLVVPAVDRALLDPPAPRAPRALLAAGQVLFGVGWALALAGALPLVLRCLLPALRAREWRAVRPLLPGAVLAAATAAAFGLVAHGAHRTPPGPVSPALVVGLGVSLALLVGFVAAVGVGPAVALGRLAPASRLLRLPAVIAAPLALVLVALAAVSVAAAAVAGWPLAGFAVVVTPLALVVACAAAVVASVSAMRGALA